MFLTVIIVIIIIVLLFALIFSLIRKHILYGGNEGDFYECIRNISKINEQDINILNNKLFNIKTVSTFLNSFDLNKNNLSSVYCKNDNDNAESLSTWCVYKQILNNVNVANIYDNNLSSLLRPFNNTTQNDSLSDLNNFLNSVAKFYNLKNFYITTNLNIHCYNGVENYGIKNKNILGEFDLLIYNNETIIIVEFKNKSYINIDDYKHTSYERNLQVVKECAIINASVNKNIIQLYVDSGLNKIFECKYIYFLKNINDKNIFVDLIATIDIFRLLGIISLPSLNLNELCGYKNYIENYFLQNNIQINNKIIEIDDDYIKNIFTNNNDAKIKQLKLLYYSIIDFMRLLTLNSASYELINEKYIFKNKLTIPNTQTQKNIDNILKIINFNNKKITKNDKIINKNISEILNNPKLSDSYFNFSSKFIIEKKSVKPKLIITKNNI